MTLPVLLVVDDDPQIRSLIERYFSKEGFVVHGLPDGLGLADFLTETAVDIILMDLGLPGPDGFTLTRQVRQAQPGVGIIILTAKNDEVDRVVGLEVGADDYVAKPFSPRELLARVRSLLRRLEQKGAVAAVQRIAGELTLDTERRILLSGDGRISLTAQEFSLIKVLLQQPNKPIDRDTISLEVRGRHCDPLDRSMDVLVGRVREKLKAGCGRELIATVRGVGYMLEV